jgi:hypothetical protein
MPTRPERLPLPPPGAHSLRLLLANAAIAAWRVGTYSLAGYEPEKPPSDRVMVRREDGVLVLQHLSRCPEYEQPKPLKKNWSTYNI